MLNETLFKDLLHPTQQICPSEWKERKSFPDKEKLKEFITARLALQEALKELLQAETKEH